VAVKVLSPDELREFLAREIREGRQLAAPTVDELVELFLPECLLQIALRYKFDVWLSSDGAMRYAEDVPIWWAIAAEGERKAITELMQHGFLAEWRRREV
jgi:hypothetical protein